MKAIVCIDDGLGMMFNRRRQSRDAHLIADLRAHLDGAPLWILPYSAPLLADSGISLSVRKDAPDAAGRDDFCLLEITDPTPFLGRVCELIIYRWNRRYPADLVFGADLSGFSLIESTEFAGSSHDKITKEVWKT